MASRPRGPRRIAPALCALLALGMFGRPTTARASTDRFERAVLVTSVNGMPVGDCLVLIGDADVRMDAVAFDRIGIRTSTGRRERIDNTTFISLASLAPGVTFTVDYTQLALRLTVAPALLGTTIVGSPSRPSADRIVASTPGGFVNYALNWRERGGADIFAEAGFSVGRALVTNTMYDRPSTGVLRGLTQMIVDDRGRLNRWTFGDRVVLGGELGGGLLLGGVVLAREYDIDPTFLRYPTVNLSGAVLAPSTVEIYANGQLVERHDLPPGQFEVNGLPVSVGRGATRVVVRDVFGRQQEFGEPYYVTTAVLSKGLHDYTYAVGAERIGAGQTSWGYSRPVAIARHRFGITNSLTAGFRFEASANILSAGPSMNWRFGFGEVELGAAASRITQARPGAAGVIGYRYVGRRLNVGTVFRTTGRSYRALGSRFATRFAVRELDLSSGLRLASAVSLTIRHVQTTEDDAFGGKRSSLTLASRVAGGADLFATIGHRGGSARGTDLLVGLSRAFSKGSGVHLLREESIGGGSATSAEVARSLPAGSGYGYRARWSDGGLQHATGQAEYQSAYGRYEARYGVAGGDGGAAISVSGAVVAVGGGLYATRSVQDAYALVRVPGLAGVRVYASHQEIGRTDRDGNLLIPNLLSYSLNELTIADDDVPLTSEIESAGRLVVPAYRAGALVQFPVRSLRIAVGTIEVMTVDGLTIPAFGELTVRAGESSVSSPVGRHGEFYLENLPAGAHPAVVEWNGRRCGFTLAIGASAARQLELGVVRCGPPGGGL